MHYGTKDKLKTTITDNIALTDALSAATAYKAYIFSSSASIIARVSFSTLAIPSATAWGASSETTKSFVMGSFPYRANQYQVYAENGEFILLPFFYHKALVQGFSVLDTALASTRLQCELTGFCVSNPTKLTLDILLQTQYTGTSYNSPILGVEKSAGEPFWKISDGSGASSIINILYQ